MRTLGNMQRMRRCTRRPQQSIVRLSYTHLKAGTSSIRATARWQRRLNPHVPRVRNRSCVTDSCAKGPINIIEIRSKQSNKRRATLNITPAPLSRTYRAQIIGYFEVRQIKEICSHAAFVMIMVADTVNAAHANKRHNTCGESALAPAATRMPAHARSIRQIASPNAVLPS